jgi:hypothetical protein
MYGNFGNASRMTALAVGLVALMPQAGLAQTSGTGGTSGTSTGSSAPGTSLSAPSSSATPQVAPTPPGGLNATIGPGGVAIAPGPSGADIPAQTIGPGGTPIAPGSAGTLGGTRIPRDPSTASSSNCVPDTTGAGVGRSGATVGMGPTPTIIAPEPGRPSEIDPTIASRSVAGSLPRC